ncbi:VTT domain-containing protein [Nocardioides sp. C4-1]|uniref:TVP38/TMEM64 family protein n=1 Tax=Nocardioides sp. C4-1 TaxID=3151851 RepID=UPI0032671C8C
MTTSEPVLGRWPRLRLVVLVVALAAAGVVFTFGDVVSTAEVQDAVDGLGPLAPLVFVVVAALLAAVLVPGPVLAAASGVLFGVVLGTVVTLASASGTAIIAQRLGRAAGLDGARSVLGPERAAATEDLLERRGLFAVVAQRLLPGVPDAPATYAFGALGARGWQVVLGTLIGAAPRAFAYTAIGDSLDDPTSPLAVAGVVVWILVSIAGAEIARRWWVGRRRARAGQAGQPG